MVWAWWLTEMSTGPGVDGHDGAAAHHIGEPRWAMAIAVIAAEVLHATLPSTVRSIGPVWIYPTVVIGLLLVLVIGDPGRIDKRDAVASRRQRSADRLHLASSTRRARSTWSD